MSGAVGACTGWQLTIQDASLGLAGSGWDAPRDCGTSLQENGAMLAEARAHRDGQRRVLAELQRDQAAAEADQRSLAVHVASLHDERARLQQALQACPAHTRRITCLHGSAQARLHLALS